MESLNEKNKSDVKNSAKEEDGLFWDLGPPSWQNPNMGLEGDASFVPYD